MSENENAATIWRDASRSLDERVADLLSQMTLEEKISQLTTSAPAIERLGLPKFFWGGECLHGICNRGRATQFPMPIGMAAAFDPALLEQVASAISDEARARHHDPAWNGPDGPWVGLAYYTPVINILRDPRWGRAQETYGEDPHLTGVLGSAFVRGLQGDHPKYLKVAACAKHLGAHSGPERLRREFNAVVSPKDLAETYMPAFGDLVDAGVATVMATYNRVNGEHSCASKAMIGDFLRGRFGFKGLVMSDGGALESLHKWHGLTKDAVETAGLCLSNGCDQEIGENAYPHTAEAIERGLTTEADVDRALSRILEVRFRVGEFDPPEEVPYTRIPREVVQCRKHIRLARKIARESVVMLKNDGLLPLGPEHQVILCTGPNAADLQVLLGNFYRGASANMRTVFEGLVEAAPEGTLVNHVQGCFLTHENVYDSTWPFGMAEWADVVVAVIGYSPLMEGEQGECIGAPDGGDKSGIDIPPNQIEFLRKMKEVGKPVLAIVTGGSPMAMSEVHELADAVLMVWYPGEQGGIAVGDVVFGKESPSGKLPVTFPRSLDQVPPFTDYALTGRTYRYMDADPMYPFGFGLSYTQMTYSELKLSRKRVKDGQSLTAAVTVTNTGQRDADEVVQLYLTDEQASVPAPRCALKGFRRIRLKAGQSRAVRFRITPEMMTLHNAAGQPMIEPGGFTVTVGGCSPGSRGAELGAPELVTGRFELR
jgi:beta-glucosidase